jgi:hypothetical protein
MMRVLNHRLTQHFLQSRVDYYEKVDADFGMPGRDYHKKTRLFFKHRHRFVRQLMQQYLGSPESYPCRVKVPSGTVLEIDGFRSESTYQGWYFRESKITIRLPKTSGKTVAYWKVNGERREDQGNGLTHVVRKGSTIEPVIAGS